MLIIADEIERLKAAIEQEKQKIAQTKQNIGTGITSLSKLVNLLVQNQLAIQDLIQQQQQTNLLINQVLEQQRMQQVEPIPISIQQAISNRFTTKIINLFEIAISGSQVLLNINQGGGIAEIVLLSSNTNSNNKQYSVRVIADGNIIYSNTWTEYTSRSNYERDMTAFEDSNNNSYVFTVQDVGFEDSCLVEVYNSQATFSSIFIKYHLKLVE